MNKLQIPRVSNRRVLNHLATLDVEIGSLSSSLRDRQNLYFKGSRHPAVLTPLGLADGPAKWLRDMYSAQRKRDDLDWIRDLREDHELDCCPMCGGTGVTELDHVLPKGPYPEFAVFALNLVPTCGNCNRRRSNKGRTHHFVHPYFDHALLDSLLLRVTFRPPYATVRFWLEPVGLTGVDHQRVERQIFHTLPPLVFRRQMRRFWSDWHKRFQRFGRASAVARLADELTIPAPSSKNSWDVAFIRGLSTSTPAQDWMAVTPLP